MVYIGIYVTFDVDSESAKNIKLSFLEVYEISILKFAFVKIVSP